MRIRPINFSAHSIWDVLFQDYADFYQLHIDDHIKYNVWNWIFSVTLPIDGQQGYQ